MPIKITTPEQVKTLHAGDIVKKYPNNGMSEHTFNAERSESINTYEIRSINTNNDMIELVEKNDRIFLSTAGDAGRLFIKSGNLIHQNIWWIAVKEINKI